MFSYIVFIQYSNCHLNYYHLAVSGFGDMVVYTIQFHVSVFPFQEWESVEIQLLAMLLM